MKKVGKMKCLALLLIVSMGLVGCNGSNGTSDNKKDKEQTTGTIEPTEKGSETNKEMQKNQWRILTTIEQPSDIYMTGFYDENYGVAVGYAGMIRYTTDGGANWTVGMNSSYCRFGLDLVSEQVGYTCGNAGHVTKTVNGGKTWEKVADFGDFEPDQCKVISFISDDVGMIAAEKKMAITKDGGTTWTELTPPEEVVTIDFISEDACYLIGKEDHLYFSKDEGKTWSSMDMSIENLDKHKTIMKSMAINMKDKDNGDLFCLDKAGKLYYYTTNDCGASWVAQDVPEVDEGSSLYFSKDGAILTVSSSDGTNVTVITSR